MTTTPAHGAPGPRSPRPRRHTVEVTDAALAAYERARLARESVEDRLLGNLDARERETLRGLLATALGE